MTVSFSDFHLFTRIRKQAGSVKKSENTYFINNRALRRTIDRHLAQKNNLCIFFSLGTNFRHLIIISGPIRNTPILYCFFYIILIFHWKMNGNQMFMHNEKCHRLNKCQNKLLSFDWLNHAKIMLWLCIVSSIR